MSDRRGAVNVKIGGLWKRSQNLSKLTKPNYKHRVFILTNQSLCYYKGTIDHISALRGRIEVPSIKAVEYVDEGAFAIKHMFQIVYYTRKYGFVPLYVIGRDDQECHEWVSELRKICQHNKEILLHYHPGSYRDCIWTCCKKSQRSAMGCHPTYSLLMRGKGSYSDLRRRISSTSVERNSITGKSMNSIPKSATSLNIAMKPSLHKKGGRRRSNEGGATMSNSFVDMTALMSADMESNAGSSKVCHSTGEISDSCITLPVDKMEGLKEVETDREGSELSHVHTTEQVTRSLILSPQPTYPDRLYYGSSQNLLSPRYTKLSLSSSHLSFRRHSSTSSTESKQFPATRKASYPVQVMSPTPVPEEEVSVLASRRVEMDLMTHSVSPTPPHTSLSQPESQASPLPQRKLISASRSRNREASRPSHDQIRVVSPFVQPRYHSQLWGIDSVYNHHLAADLTAYAIRQQPQIKPHISESHPCVIHL